MRNQLQKTLGDAYRLERELGGGGMSRVFVAEEQRLERKVVVKVLSPDLAQGSAPSASSARSAPSPRLQQANIVPVLTAGDTDGLPFYTMPFVEGESLRAHLARGPLAITEVVGIMRDVAKALAYAHQRGVVHRDIKPDNVLLSGGTAVVTDFGIAKAISAARTGLRSRDADADRHVDRHAGVHGAGAGRRRREHRSPRRHLRARRDGVRAARRPAAVRRTGPRNACSRRTWAKRRGRLRELRADVPAPLADLVMRCLAKDPNDRPQTAGDIVRVLETITSGSGMPAMPPVLLGGPGMFRRGARDLRGGVRRRWRSSRRRRLSASVCRIGSSQARSS